MGKWHRRADIVIMDEKKSGIDIKNLFISYFDVVFDKKYLLKDIFYQKQTK